MCVSGSILLPVKYVGIGGNGGVTLNTLRCKMVTL
jgi:hypothetical protein